ncbi:MAG: hypothetical protein C0392_02990 [Syntrophus sp. (in: bacteria)]|nr:hypothetical protein [Syntrophus sp. (in: bacteria)]
MEKPYAHDGALQDDQSLPHSFVPVTEPGKPVSPMSPAEHLNEAKNALADGYRVDANPVKSVWGRIGDARMHLAAIEPGSSQYVPARRLLRETLSRERQIENVSMHVTNQLMVKQREMMANELELYYVAKGILVEVELSGPDKTAIKLLSSAFCELTIDRIADKTNFFSHLKEAGFKRVILGDHEENIWSYNLKMM